MSAVFPKEILPLHTAILGMTGSGKSTTARDLVEQVVPEGSRVCILDTVKSDWWGITSSADGKKPGLPFTILGGPHAHLPLSRNMGKALGELVASGALPLSIIDMADFGPGDPSHFFVDFAQALMRKMKGVLYLVIEEAHELAPKERVGFAKENMGVYWAKKLATAGRSKGIRLVVLSQRVQSLHNAVLGSCQTVVVHNMTTPADQKPVVDWLKGNVKDPALRKQVEESLTSLPTGSGWLCSGQAKLFELTKFPRSKTFDNTATPEDDSALQDVKTATVDVEQLRTLLAGAVKEAEANDVTSLKRRIAELERDIRKATPIGPAVPIQITDTTAIEAKARKEGFDLALANMKNLHQDYVVKVRKTLDGVVLGIVEAAMDTYGALEYEPLPPRVTVKMDLHRQKGNPLVPYAEMTKILQDGFALTSAAHPKGNGKMPRPRLSKDSLETIEIDLPLTPVQRRIIDRLAQLEQMGSVTPSAELLSLMCGYSNYRSKGFANALGSLRTGGLIEGLALTEEGRRVARPDPAPVSSEELQRQLIMLLGNTAGKILQPLIDAYPDGLGRAGLAADAGYQNMRSKGFANALGRLRTLGFIEYGSAGTVTAKPVLFLQ